MTKLWFSTATLMLVMLVGFGCQKKQDDAPPPGAPACAENHRFSPHFNRCVFNGQCPVGYVQTPSQPSMCIEITAGQHTFTQQCGTGFVLTVNGCKAPCPDPSKPGWGIEANTCIQGINVGGYYNATQQPYQQSVGQPAYQQPYQQYPWGNQMAPVNQYNPYMMNYWPNYYRGF